MLTSLTYANPNVILHYVFMLYVMQCEWSLDPFA